MVQINFKTHEVACKIVYYGPPGSGKTTSLQAIRAKVPAEHYGELVTFASEGDRIVWFDYTPDLKLGNMRVKFRVFTVPGQVYYNATKKTALEGVDGVVFVADARESEAEENTKSLVELGDNLREVGVLLEALPAVFQWNKADLRRSGGLFECDKTLNLLKAPSFVTEANHDVGVWDTFRTLTEKVIDKLRVEYGLGGDKA